ncbi:MAG TPA: hypothetical protein VJA47_04470 [archaeon]|nr:hypothetical protein [archaeon]
MGALRRFLLGLGLVYGLTLPNDSVNRTPNSETVSVGWGEIGYNNGPLESKGFHYCSAVILDYGNEALLAHAFQSFHYKSCTATVADDLVRESRKHGLYPKSAEAILNIGNKDDLEQIEGGLREHGIRIREVVIDEPVNIGTHMDIYYDPLTNFIRVTHKEVDD